MTERESIIYFNRNFLKKLPCPGFCRGTVIFSPGWSDPRGNASAGRRAYFEPGIPPGAIGAAFPPASPRTYFNPRSPCGERLAGAASPVPALPFQSTLPVWAATSSLAAYPLPTRQFQSTFPMWGATNRDGSLCRARGLPVRLPAGREPSFAACPTAVLWRRCSLSGSGLLKASVFRKPAYTRQE